MRQRLPPGLPGPATDRDTRRGRMVRDVEGEGEGRGGEGREGRDGGLVCDSAYHLDCLDPPLTEIPDVDEW